MSAVVAPPSARAGGGAPRTDVLSSAVEDAVGMLARLDERPGVCVVVPVFNGGDAVRRCLDSVRRHTRNARVVVIDDGSTDARVVELLDARAANGTVEVVRHSDNWGYTRTANHAVELAGRDDVVLLNSDTEVGPMWLQRLTWVAYSEPSVATACAVSDNAGAMALPVTGRANSWAPHLTWSEVARGAAQAEVRWAVRVPTSHGFCMFVRRAALDRVGGFDAEAFPRGYGEENDFCLRASSAGFSHLMAPHVLVKHQRSASFGHEARQLLAAQARDVLDERWPSYTKDVRSWLGGTEMDEVRAVAERLCARLAASSEVLPRRLYVLHRAGGGTPATNRDLLGELVEEQDSYVLDSTGKALELFRWTGDGLTSVLRWEPVVPFRVTDTWRPDYAEVVTRLVVALGVELVHVRHLVNHPLTTLPEVLRLLDVPFVLSTHDFYYVCPSVQLLDEQNRFCGGRCSSGEGSCRLPMPFVEGIVGLKNGWVHEWRRRVRSVLAAADVVIATTEGTAAVYRDVFGEDLATKLRVVEHGRDTGGSWGDLRAGRPRRPGPLRVLAPANWGPHKGSDYLREVAWRVGDAVEWHVAGSGSHQLEDVAVTYGRYDRESLARLADEVDPDLVAIFSAYAETYSHTLTEAWALGLPVITTDVGAVPERIRRHGGGVIVPVDDVGVASRSLQQLASDPANARERAGSPPAGGVRSALTMAADYARIYQELSDGEVPLVAGYVVRGRRGKHPDEVQHRLLRWAAQEVSARPTHWQPVDPGDVVRGQDNALYDVCLVHHAALRADEVAPFVDVLHRRGARVVVDVGDGACLAPDAGRAEVVRAMVRRADRVLTSDLAAADLVEAEGVSVRVVADVLDARAWTCATSQEGPGPAGPVRLLHLPGPVPEEELAEVRRVAAALAAAGEQVLVEVLDLEATLTADGDHGWQPVRPPAGTRGYGGAVRWLRSQSARWRAVIVPVPTAGEGRAHLTRVSWQAALMGLPVVAGGHVDPREQMPNVEVHDGRPSSWVGVLQRVLASAPEAEQVVRKAREEVLASRVMSPRHVDDWRRAVVGGAATRPVAPRTGTVPWVPQVR